MNSEEALQFIINTFNELAEKSSNTESVFKFYEAHEIIKHDLDKLKEINNIWHENEPLECVDINGKHLQEVYNFLHEILIENERLKKFAIHFKKDIQEGLQKPYRCGENIIYDSLLAEFGKSFLNDLLKEVS